MRMYIFRFHRILAKSLRDRTLIIGSLVLDLKIQETNLTHRSTQLFVFSGYEWQFLEIYFSPKVLPSRVAKLGLFFQFEFRHYHPKFFGRIKSLEQLLEEKNIDIYDIVILPKKILRGNNKTQIWEVAPQPSNSHRVSARCLVPPLETAFLSERAVPDARRRGR